MSTNLLIRLIRQKSKSLWVISYHIKSIKTLRQNIDIGEILVNILRGLNYLRVGYQYIKKNKL